MNKKILSLLMVVMILFTLTPVSIATSVTTESTEVLDISALEFSDTISDMYSPIELPEEAVCNVQIGSLPAASLDVAAKSTSLALSTFSSNVNTIDSETTSTKSASAGGTYWISENYLYSDSLASASDYNAYLCEISANCEATAFVDSSSSMDFSLEMLIFTDTSMNTLRTDAYSAVNASPYGGQRIRKQVYAGEVVAFIVSKNPNSTFTNNSYNLGVLTQTSVSDTNNHPDGATWHSISLTANVLSGNSIQLDSVYDVDWYVFNYVGSSTHYPTVAFASGSNSIAATIYTRGSNGQMTKVKDIYNDGVYRDIRNLTTQTYYIAVYTTSNVTGGYALATQLQPVYFVEKLVKISLQAYGDIYSPNNFGYGVRETSRYKSTVSVTIRDTKNNLVTDFPFAVSFDSGSLGPIAAASLTTNSSGSASTVLTLTVLPSTYFARYRVSSNTVHLYQQAKVKVTLPSGFSCTYSGDAEQDVYHFGGTTI